MGFCLFNNVAIAAELAVRELAVGRVLIIDWDVHHGNGTAEIFAGSAEVLFASVHEFPLYPGSGRPSEIGHGAGEGLTVNLPVPGGTGDETWAGITEDVVLPIAREWAPQLILVSAGYDAHADDPSTAFSLSRLTDAGVLHQAPIGIFRQVDRPTYDDQARDQIATASAGQGDQREALASLISGGDTWTVV